MTRDGAHKIADLYAEIIDCPTDVRADLATVGGWEIVAGGMVVAHIGARGDIHAILGLHVLTEIAEAAKMKRAS